jgi:hypothetical protein
VFYDSFQFAGMAFLFPNVEVMELAENHFLERPETDMDICERRGL